MDIEILRIFLDIQHFGSLTAASNIHHITQSALSKRVAQLEGELGVVLFQRGKGQSRIHLTAAGEAFSDIAERILTLWEQAQTLRNNPSRQFLSIACIRSAHDTLLPSVLRSLKTDYPNLCVTVEDRHTAEILELVENRRFDTGIALLSGWCACPDIMCIAVSSGSSG